MAKLLGDPRGVRLLVYGVSVVLAVVGIVSGVTDYDTVTQWFGDDGVVAYVTLAAVSILAGANITPKKSEEVVAAQQTVDELSDLRRRMAS